MIHESLIDKSLNRLSLHFGPRLVVRPPAPAADIAALETLAGPLPRELRILLATCDGFRVSLEGHDAHRHLWHVAEMLTGLREGSLPALPCALVPVSGDPAGERDWVATGPGPLHDAVIRWDPWSTEVEVVATGFGSYLDAWTRYLVAHYDADGRPVARTPIPPFSAPQVEPFDPRLPELRRRTDVQTMLAAFAAAVVTGAEFD